VFERAKQSRQVKIQSIRNRLSAAIFLHLNGLSRNQTQARSLPMDWSRRRALKMKKLLIVIGVILIAFILFSFSLYRLHLSHAAPLAGTSPVSLHSPQK
jgi:hypothetical protein